MRLVDADAFYKRYCEMYEDGVDDGEIDRIAYMISTEPTAYDVEKVVEQLENHRAKFDCRVCKYNKTEKQVCTKDCTDALIDGLLDIVRKGGVE